MNITTLEKVAEKEEQGVRVPIDDENGKPAWYGGKLVSKNEETGEEVWEGRKRVTITVAGTLSKRHRRAQENNRGSILKMRGRKAASGSKSLRQQSETVARTVISWEGFTQGTGDDEKEFPFTVANAVAVFTKFPFIQEQVEAAMDDHESFTEGVSLD